MGWLYNPQKMHLLPQTNSISSFKEGKYLEVQP